MTERLLWLANRLISKLDYLNDCYDGESVDLFNYVHEDVVYYAEQIKEILISMMG